MRRLLATAIAVAALVVSLGALPARAGGYVPGDETHVRNLVNATRAGKGLSQLAGDADLVGMARRQADRMAAKGSIFHNLKLGDEITSSGLDWLKAGENVGMGPDVDLVEDAFLKSPLHYDNIVDPKYDTVGIGVVEGADGRRYVVQVFADLKPASAPPRTAPAPATAPASTAPATQAAPAITAPPAVQAPATATPDPAPAPPAPRPPSADPNAVVGGVIQPLDLGV